MNDHTIYLNSHPRGKSARAKLGSREETRHERRRKLQQMVATICFMVLGWSYKNLQHLAATNCCVKNCPRAMIAPCMVEISCANNIACAASLDKLFL